MDIFEPKKFQILFFLLETENEKMRFFVFLQNLICVEKGNIFLPETIGSRAG